MSASLIAAAIQDIYLLSSDSSHCIDDPNTNHFDRGFRNWWGIRFWCDSKSKCRIAPIKDQSSTKQQWMSIRSKNEWRFRKLSSSSIDWAYNQPVWTTFYRSFRLKRGLLCEELGQIRCTAAPELHIRCQNWPIWQYDHRWNRLFKLYRLVALSTEQ